MLLVIFLFTLGLFISIYSLNLKIYKKNETNLFENVSLTMNVPTEFDSEGAFWWLSEGKNVLTLNNFSNEIRKVHLNIKFENNPCQNLSSINIIEVQNYDFYKNPSFVGNYSLNPYENKQIELNILTKNSCNVKADKRNFGAKLRSWFVR